MNELNLFIFSVSASACDLQDDWLKECQASASELLLASHSSFQRLLSLQVQMRKMFVWLLQSSRLEMGEREERIHVPIDTQAVLKAIHFMRTSTPWPKFFDTLVTSVGKIQKRHDSLSIRISSDSPS